MREVNYKFARNPGGNAKYDWDQILNGQTWELVQGEDFEMEPRTFVAHCHGTAKRRNLKVRTHIDLSKKAVIVRAYDENDLKERKTVVTF